MTSSATAKPIAALEAMFAANKAAGRKAVAPFVTAGDPDPGTTVAVLEASTGRGQRSANWACRIAIRSPTGR